MLESGAEMRTGATTAARGGASRAGGRAGTAPRRSTTGHCAGLCAWLSVVCALNVDGLLEAGSQVASITILFHFFPIVAAAQHYYGITATNHHTSSPKNNMRKAITVNLSIANSNSIISRTAASKITAATATRQSATAVSSGSDRIPFSHVPIS